MAGKAVADDELEIVLEDVQNTLCPGNMSVTTQLKLLSLLEDAIKSASPPNHDDVSPALSVPVRIESGSIKTYPKVGEWAKPGLNAILVALKHSNYKELPVKSHEKLCELSRQLTSKNLKLTIGDSQGIKVEISNRHPVKPLKVNIISTDTSIYGQVVWVGGVEPSAYLILTNTKGDLKVKIDTKELASEIAGRLYDVVGLQGKASLDYATGEIVAFHATKMLPYLGKNADPILGFKKGIYLKAEV